MLKIKRVYEKAKEDDGYRILIDRLWPRGLSKEKAEIKYWAKEIAPSNNLRKTFHRGEINFDEFKELYIKELNSNQEGKAFLEIIDLKLKEGDITLLYGSKNEKNNNGLVLKDWLEEHL